MGRISFRQSLIEDRNQVAETVMQLEQELLRMRAILELLDEAVGAVSVDPEATSEPNLAED